MKSMLKFGAEIARTLAAVTMLLTGVAASQVVLADVVASEAHAAVARSITVRGNQRVDASTVKSYLTIEPGRSYSSFDADESLKALYATGLFSDVSISQSGSTLIVTVAEHPTINLVLFEGNENVTDDRLKVVPQSQSLAVYDPDRVESDRERVREVIRRSGRSAAEVTTRVDELENNRVNIVFVINEGGRTKITSIDFIGNQAFGDSRLQEVISHNESNILSWLKRDDVFDPDRLQADEERLRQFYYNHGYADFRVISSDAELNAAENTYTISITVEEGDRYTFGRVEIDNALTVVRDEELLPLLRMKTGDVYSARSVEKSLVALTDHIAETGYAFAEVTPRGDRDFETRTINLSFFVDEGPRVYIERIEVYGNNRSRGYVIRREFDVSEGDPYNRVLVNRAKQRLEALGFFQSVRISTRPGSAPDRVVVVVNVVDKATGEFSIGGGYSTNDGPVAEISVAERNFLGRGQYLKVAGAFGGDSTKYSLSFTEPYFLGERIAAGFDISQEDTDSTSDVLYSTTTSIARLRAKVALSDYLSMGANYTYKNEEITADATLTDGNAANGELSAATKDSVNRSPYVTSSIGYNLTYTDLDSFKLPREGVKATFSQDFAGVGGDAQYIRTEARFTGYMLLSEDRDVVLLGSVGAGHIQSFGNDSLRIVDNFFQGGESIRGFDSRGFGPRDTATGEALGGETYVNATAELQAPLPLLPRSYGLRAAVFVDAGTLFGNSFANAANPTVKDDAELRASVGASIIWDSPFGPLRADFAQAVAKADYDEEQFFRFGVSSRF